MFRLLELGGVSRDSLASRHTPLADGVVHHVELGNPRNPNVVLLHGAGGGLANWYRLIPALAREHHVYAVDLPGFGLSDSRPIEKSPAQQAEKAIAEWADKNDINYATWIGTSFGGLVALRFAQHFPARVERLVLIDTAGAGRECTPLVHIGALPLLGPLVLSPSRGGTRALLRKLLTTKRLEPEEEDALVEYLYQSAKRSGPRWMARALRRFAGSRGQRDCLSYDELRRIETKTLVVWGRRDRFFPVAHAHQLATALPHATLQVIEHAGHSPNWERPQELIETMLRFLEAE